MKTWKASLVAALVLLGGACGGGVAQKTSGFFDITYLVGKEPAKVEVPDLDCDGSPDIVALCPGDSSITCLRRLPVNNLGSSGQDGVDIQLLTSPVETQGLGSSGQNGVEVRVLVPNTTKDFCIADLNGDGFPDICAITGDPDFDLLRIMNRPNDPGNMVLEPLMNSVGGSPSRVAAGDVNGDGLADVVVLDEETGACSLFLNSKASPGTFLLPAVVLPSFGPKCHDLLLGDLDGDGLMEPMSLTADGNFTFDRQSPRGSFKQKAWLCSNFRLNLRMAMGDVTGDGLPDIVIASDTAEGSEIHVLEQDPTSPAGLRESPTRQSLGKHTIALALHDMNRDGVMDLVTREIDSTGSASVGLSLGFRESPTRFSERRLVADNIGSSGQDGVAIDLGSVQRNIAIGDLQRDGFFDIFTEVSLEGSVHVLVRESPTLIRESPTLIRESPTFTRALQIDSPPGVTWNDVATGDLNGDGKLDFVTGGSDGLTVHFQDAAAPLSFHSKTMAGLGVSIDRVAVADVDGDGRLDVAFSSQSGNLVGVVFHNAAIGEVFDPPAGSLFPTPSPRDIALGDLDGDGRCDIATTFDGAAGGAVRCDFQQSAPKAARAFTGFVDYPTGSPLPTALSVKDDDCDGHDDIACANGDGSLSFLRHAPGFPPPGPAVYLPPVVYPFAGGVRVAAADLDGDGREDLVTIDPAGVTITLQRSDDPRGTYQPSFKIHHDLPIGDPDFDLLSLHLDGGMDIVLSGDVDGDGFEVLFHDPTALDGFTMIRESPTKQSLGKRVATGDVNGDGWPDVVTLSSPEPGSTSHHLVLWTQVPGHH